MLIAVTGNWLGYPLSVVCASLGAGEFDVARQAICVSFVYILASDPVYRMLVHNIDMWNVHRWLDIGYVCCKALVVYLMLI